MEDEFDVVLEDGSAEVVARDVIAARQQISRPRLNLLCLKWRPTTGPQEQEIPSDTEKIRECIEFLTGAVGTLRLPDDEGH